ncbi:MAG: hypothetical protein ACFB51_03005 [Anaerolineae bacterium]
MDINFFSEPEMSPRPRDEMAIFSLTADPIDERRVRVTVEVTPFTPQDRPNVEISAHNAAEQPVGSMSIIETMHRTFALTLHIREPEPSGVYTLSAELFYEPGEIQHTLTETFEIPERGSSG